jgi:hypothetical protein
MLLSDSELHAAHTERRRLACPACFHGNRHTLADLQWHPILAQSIEVEEERRFGPRLINIESRVERRSRAKDAKGGESGVEEYYGDV